MNDVLKKQLFQCSLDSSGVWLLNAIWLKRASEEIDYFEHQDANINSPEGDFRFMCPVFNLLIGLSFENLLKGIIVAQRGSAGTSGKVDNDFITHKMNDLITLVDQSVLPISNEEIDLLNNLEKYVVWAGRYPFPKRSEHLFCKMQSDKEHVKLLSFWNRLYEYLKSVGWIKKMGGHRLQTDKSNNQTKT